MGTSVLATFIKRQYELGSGGVYGHVENGKLVTYVPGSKIWLTDEEAKQKALVGRLTLVDNKVSTFTEEVAQPTTETTSPTTAPADTATVPTPASPAPIAVTTIPPVTIPTAKRDKITDWSFVPKSLTETLVDLIDDLDDVADLKAMQAAEKSRNDGGRRRVNQAINSRMRQLNMAKARAVKEANQAKKRADKAGEGDKGEVGTE